jgi:AcrR family transcriptional regulator
MSAVRQRDPRVDRTRQAVLDAVRAILVEEGWEAVTHVRISERTGVARTTLYRHWPDKTQLLHDAIVDQSIALRPTRTGNLREDLLSDLDGMMTELVQNRIGTVLAALIDRAEWDPALLRLKASFVAEAVAALRDLLRDARARHELDPALDVDVAVAELVGPIAYRRLVSAEPILPAFIASVVDDFLRAHRPRSH